jgi:methanogenic corrinoid protein MtbC1
MSSDDQGPTLPPVDPTGTDRLPGETVTPELLASLLADGDDELAAWVLRQALADAPRAQVYDGILAQAMHLVGERWATGQWSVAEEHLASQTLLRALDRVRPDFAPESRIGPVAVLAGVAGEQHMIGLVCLAQVLAERGWTVTNLGADVPASDLGRFVSRNDARLVALSASDPARIGTAAEAIDAVRAATGPRGPEGRIPIMLGGRLASVPSAASALEVDWHGHSLVEAVAFADTVLDGSATRKH